MQWGTARRLDDFMRVCDGRHTQTQDDHRELRDSIKDLSDQTRGEFRAMKEEVERRHGENRKQAWAIFGIILAAVLASYFGGHGLRVPGIGH